MPKKKKKKKDIYQHMARYPLGKAISVTARCMIGISDKFRKFQMITDEFYITQMININPLFKTKIKYKPFVQNQNKI